MRHLFLTILAATIFAATLAAQGQSQMRFQASVSPTNVTPPLRNMDASGDCELAINLVRNQSGDPTGGLVDFTCNLGLGLNQGIDAMYIHRGERGQNGGVVLSSNFGDPVMAGPGQQRIFRQVEVVDTPGLQVLQEIMGNPGGFYLQIHSSENPAGFCRDQLRLHDADRLTQMERQMDRLNDTTGSINDRVGRMMQRQGLKP